MPVASAQVKSAILLAGLYAKGITRVIEPIRTRDHTERMLRLFKADIKVKHLPSSTEATQSKGGLRRVVRRSLDGGGQNKIVIKGNRELVSPKEVYIPGDISSGSFFIVLAAILPNSQIVIRNASINPSRMGIIRVLKRMGANIKINPSTKLRVDGERSRTIKNYEPMGDIMVKSSSLKGATVKKEEIPSLIDELPILMVAACNAKGKSIFEGVSELRVKETDRIKSMSENLKKMGADIEVVKINSREKIIIKGAKELRGTRVRSFGDHRTAMCMVVAGLKAKGRTLIDDIACIHKSFPDILSILRTHIQ